MSTLHERLGELLVLLARKQRLDQQREGLNRMDTGSYDAWRDDALVLILEMIADDLRARVP